MENPAEEIRTVIHLLTQSSPSTQRDTIARYLTHDAAFLHPFCRIGSFENSRFFIHAIYRWYKIMSPRIELTIHSIAYDAPNLLLYVSMSQVFRIWAVPFHRSAVRLVTVLQLAQDKADGRYYIVSQNDLYQTDQLVRFFWPGGFLVVWLWQLVATLMCLLGAVVLWPVSAFEEYVMPSRGTRARLPPKR